MDVYDETLYGEATIVDFVGLVGVVCDLLIEGTKARDKGGT